MSPHGHCSNANQVFHNYAECLYRGNSRNCSSSCVRRSQVPLSPRPPPPSPEDSFPVISSLEMSTCDSQRRQFALQTNCNAGHAEYLTFSKSRNFRRSVSFLRSHLPSLTKLLESFVSSRAIAFNRNCTMSCRQRLFSSLKV